MSQIFSFIAHESEQDKNRPTMSSKTLTQKSGKFADDRVQNIYSFL